MSILKLSQQKKNIEIKNIIIDNKIVFEYFHKQPESERDELFFRALYIGVLALMEDRLASFLSKTKNELGTELESLKLIFDMNKEVFFKSTQKGTIAEGEIVVILNEYFQEKNLKDIAKSTGEIAGSIPKNKTGDIVIEVDGNPDLKIVIEVKIDKSLKLGDISKNDIFTKKSDTAWSQIIESQVNREAKASMIVFDKSIVDSSILELTENVAYINGVGLVAIVDSQRGDYSNLIIAYFLARDIAMNLNIQELDKSTLVILIQKIVKDIKGYSTIKNIVETNIKNNRKILETLEKSFLLMEFNLEYLQKFLNDGTLTKDDLFEFYSGESVKKKYALIEDEIKGM